jgi:flagellar hook-associated protein 2
MAGLQLSGLASGFDWKTFTDSVMEMERAPARRYEAEQTKNDNKKSQLSSLGTKLSSLQTAMTALASSSLGAGRKVVNENSSAVVQATVSSATPVGTYEVQVTHLATASRLTGSLLASAPTGVAGTLNIRGTADGAVTPIAISADMDVAAIVAKINNSEAGVTAICNKAGTQIVLTNQVTGAGNDIVVTDESGGSLRRALGLATTPTTKATGDTESRLTGSVLASPTTGVAGTLNIRGTAAGAVTSIPISADMDVAAIVSAINDSEAGVNATSNEAGTQIVLTNQVSGIGNDIVVTDASGGALLSALGLATTPTTNATDTAFTINGLGFTSADNTLNSDDHGVAGLSLKAGAVMTSAEVLTVSADASGMRSKIDAFVSSFNSVADFIESSTSYTTTAGKTTAGLLADNREIQTWLRQLRTTAFGSPAFGAITNLSALGLDFSSSNSRLTVTDSTKLDAALADHASDVAKFFNNTATGSTGLASAFVTKLDAYIGTDGTTGQLNTKLETYTKANTALDGQIANLDRYLAQRRSQLEAGFMAMETAQSKMTQMQTQLTNAFGQKK